RQVARGALVGDRLARAAARALVAAARAAAVLARTRALAAADARGRRQLARRRPAAARARRAVAGLTAASVRAGARRAVVAAAERRDAEQSSQGLHRPAPRKVGADRPQVLLRHRTPSLATRAPRQKSPQEVPAHTSARLQGARRGAGVGRTGAVRPSV